MDSLELIPEGNGLTSVLIREGASETRGRIPTRRQAEFNHGVIDGLTLKEERRLIALMAETRQQQDALEE